jgi:hypothetical protein
MKSDQDSDISEALDALQDWTQPALDGEVLICECFCVSVNDIRITCLEGLDLDLLAQLFGFGTGCMTCLKDLPKWKSLVFEIK